MVRYKNRYFAIEIEATDRPEHAPLELRRTSLYHAILRAVELLHGDFGVAASANGFVAKYCNPYTKVAIIRARHGPHRFIATALPLIRVLLNTVPVRIRIIYVGATISKCFKFIARHQQKTLERYWNKMKTDEDRRLMKEALLDLAEMKMVV